jgi:hypothetical protein
VDARAEAMAGYGVTQCPDWCIQSEGDDEVAYEAHIGSWETPVDGDVTIEVRPERDWWTVGEEADCEGRVRMTVSGSETVPTSDGATADMVLTVEECAALTQAIDAARQQAETVASWVWAYDGAEADEAEVQTVLDRLAEAGNPS